jgi:putative membrane protein
MNSEKKREGDDRMAKKIHGLFKEADVERVTAAVAAAEKGTSGEIVPYVVASSDHYTETVWRAVAAAMGVALATLGIISLTADTWMKIGIAATAIIALAAGLIAGVLFMAVPALRRMTAGSDVIARRVAARAAQAFLAEEVFATGERVGILIFLSILERRVVVLADSGINARVEQAEWNGIVATIIAGIRTRKPADGLITAIATCGAILKERGFTIQPGDINELPDTLRGEI